MATGQWLVDRVGTRWFFDSGALSLDFGYTGDWGYGVPDWEHLHGPDDLTDWLTGRFGPLAAPASHLKPALELRQAITSVAMALADGGTPPPTGIDVINEWAAGTDVAPALDGGHREPPRPTVARALASVARDAVATFRAEPGRVRRCDGDNCALVFLDSSRAHSRRWCSMRRCGNRTKVRIHRAKENS